MTKREFFDHTIAAFGAMLFGSIIFIGLYAFAQPTGSNTNPPNVLPAVTFANLPTAPAIGTMYYMTDGLAANCADTNCTTYGTNVTGGGGALKLFIWWNGLHWTTVGK